ncbi:hypothetical protein EVAR_7396_1 [Eumeta japonica]|uniref:Uncharacterized protein n=1 Tax=Eumeta variegata TaxID=151549 RepID=A0A4C1V8K6_EUMVA|nr:hypothetical protein EVAR_7396_1 [Eumeta japonica]
MLRCRIRKAFLRNRRPERSGPVNFISEVARRAGRRLGNARRVQFLPGALGAPRAERFSPLEKWHNITMIIHRCWPSARVVSPRSTLSMWCRMDYGVMLNLHRHVHRGAVCLSICAVANGTCGASRASHPSRVAREGLYLRAQAAPYVRGRERPAAGEGSVFADLRRRVTSLRPHRAGRGGGAPPLEIEARRANDVATSPASKSASVSVQNGGRA